jgi:hypothetical protein
MAWAIHFCGRDRTRRRLAMLLMLVIAFYLLINGSKTYGRAISFF